MVSKQEYEKLCIKREGIIEAGYPVPPEITSKIEEYEAELAKGADTPIYTLLKSGNKHGVSPEKARCVEETVEELLSTAENATEPGLLLGKIQCGKTDTFEMIIGLAFDKGFDIAVVLTKNSNALAKQTVTRFKLDFASFLNPADNPANIKVVIEDIMATRSNYSKSGMRNAKIVWVVKKEKKNMDHLIARFENDPRLKDKRVLIVDDEADFASRNYRNVQLGVKNDDNGKPIAQDSETELAVISRQIDDFRRMSDAWRYLQVTATPYCLFLQPDEKIEFVNGEALCFRPRFTKLVPIHNGYIGGQQYFVDAGNEESMFSHVYKPVNQECVNRLGIRRPEILRTNVRSTRMAELTEALVGYLMATAVRRIQTNPEYTSSAVVHVSVAVNNHKWQHQLISRMIESIGAYFAKPEGSDVALDAVVNKIYDDFVKSNHKARERGNVLYDEDGNVRFTKKVDKVLPSKEAIRAEVDFLFKDNADCVNEFVKIVNSKEDLNRLIDDTNGQLRLDAAINIFIGGNNLDRGITINNMLMFFYGRDPKSFQQDTVLQHARFYGARNLEDMAVTRLYTTRNIYKALESMNALDEDLRQSLIRGMGTKNPVIFIGYDDNVKPCATSKIAPSKTIPLSGDKNIAPRGMQTGNKAEISSTVAHIDSLIENAMQGVVKDEWGFFQMNADVAEEILRLIELTYRYDAHYDNLSQKKDMEQLRAILAYCLEKSEGKLFALYATDRNAKRIKETGLWNDMPADGKTQVGPAKLIAQNAPVLILLRENGSSDQGWRGTPFYWPVLKTQANLNRTIFASGLKTKGQVVVNDLSELIKGLNIPSDEILSLTYIGDLAEHFGKEGTVYDEPVEYETRAIRETNAGTYLKKALNGELEYADGVDPEKDITAGVYSYNHDKLPFVLKPYKYMILRQGRSAREAMLLKLFPMDKWIIYANRDFDAEGDLYDYVTTDKVLFNINDVLVNTKGEKKAVKENGLCQWVVAFAVKEVVRHVQFRAPVDEAEDCEE